MGKGPRLWIDGWLEWGGFCTDWKFATADTSRFRECKRSNLFVAAISRRAIFLNSDRAIRRSFGRRVAVPCGPLKMIQSGEKSGERPSKPWAVRTLPCDWCRVPPIMLPRLVAKVSLRRHRDRWALFLRLCDASTRESPHGWVYYSR